jgi:hypothetical protein
MSARSEEFTRLAREWALECAWKEDPEDIAEMSDAEILRGVTRHYEGGLAQFAQDGLLKEEGWAR